MLIVTMKRYKKQHIIGGSGITPLRLFTSRAAKSAASALASSAAKQAGKHIVDRMLTSSPVASVLPTVEPPTPQIPTFQPAPLVYQGAPQLTQKSKEDL